MKPARAAASSRFNYFYLALLPIFFVFHGWAENYPLVPISECLVLLGIYLLAALALTALAQLYFRNWAKSFFYVFLLLVFYLFFGKMHDGLRSVAPLIVTRFSILLPVCIIAFIAIAVLLKKRWAISRKLILYLNLALLLFIVIDIGKLTMTKESRTLLPAAGELKIGPCGPASPDVYLIVADEYAGNTELKDLFHFDNSVFLDSLRSRNFFVSSHSNSNYNFTLYSMASILNMQYLDLGDKQVVKADPVYAYKMIFDSRVVKFFTDMGYEFYNRSYFDFRDHLTGTDNSFVPKRTTIFTSQTLLGRLEKELLLPSAGRFGLTGLLKEKTYENLNYNKTLFNEAISISGRQATKPKFVYMHFAMPHYPFYFDRDGHEYDYEVLKHGSMRDNKRYVGYLQYANGRLLQLIDSINNGSTRKPIIVLMGDHGFRKLPPGAPDKYQFMNLASVSVPGGDYHGFGDSLSAVNTFRALLNTAFCQQLPMIDNKSTIVIRF